MKITKKLNDLFYFIELFYIPVINGLKNLLHILHFKL